MDRDLGDGLPVRQQLSSVSVSPTGSSQSVTKLWSGTQRSGSASLTVHCALVAGGASGALVSLQRVDVLPAGATAVAIAGAEAAEVRSDEAVTGPVSRQALLGGYTLAANMSLALGGNVRGVDDTADGWTLVDALLDVVTAADAFPVLSASIGVTSVSSYVAGREQLLVCLLRPPNGTGSSRWLPSTLSAFRDVTLRLRLRLRCPTDTAVTQDVVVVVPSPGQAMILAVEVKNVAMASQYALWVGAPGPGTAVGRLSAVRSLVLCSGEASVDGMLPLRSAVDCEDSVVASNSAADARGAVLGNAVLWAAGCVLMGLLTCGYSRGAAVPLRSAAEALGVPSPLLPLVVATVPSTVSSTFVLLRSSCAADSAVAALGVAMCVAPLAVLWALALTVEQQLHTTGRERATAPAARCTSAHLIRMRLLQRRLSWAAAPLAPDVVGHGMLATTVNGSNQLNGRAVGEATVH